MNISAYSTAEADAWDDYCAGTHAGTFLHTRRFLSYHGERFQDCSLVLKDEKDECVGLFPAAVDVDHDPKCVISHPGITYGGILHAGELRGEAMIEAMAAIWAHYQSRGYELLRYKVVPHIYQVTPCQDDLYALFRLGAHRYRCDLSSAIDLGHRLPPSRRRKRSLKKAAAAALEITDDLSSTAEFWTLLEANLAQKHSAKPTHSLQEISLLMTRFPHNIGMYSAHVAGQLVAGVVTFMWSSVVHAQYIASNEQGNGVGALDALFEHIIHASMQRNVRWFDFGISNEDAGQVLNQGLYQFKSEFGGGGVVHEFYELRG